MGSRHDELRGRVGVATGRPAWAHGHATKLHPSSSSVLPGLGNLGDQIVDILTSDIKFVFKSECKSKTAITSKNQYLS